MGPSWVLSPVDPSGLLDGQHDPTLFLTEPALPGPVSLASLSSQAGQIPWPGFKSTQANRPQTGLTLNYLHEWSANPIFISTQLCNALCDLLRTDLPGCFRSAWVTSFSISTMPMDWGWSLYPSDILGWKGSQFG